jgi:hypothetical protein
MRRKITYWHQHREILGHVGVELAEYIWLMELIQSKHKQFPKLTQIYLKSRRQLHPNENEPQVAHVREITHYPIVHGVKVALRLAGIELKVLHVMNRYVSESCTQESWLIIFA